MLNTLLLSSVDTYFFSRLLCNNRFEGSIPVEIRKLSMLTDIQFDEILTSAAAAGIGCVNRKFGHW